MSLFSPQVVRIAAEGYYPDPPKKLHQGYVALTRRFEGTADGDYGSLSFAANVAFAQSTEVREHLVDPLMRAARVGLRTELLHCVRDGQRRLQRELEGEFRDSSTHPEAERKFVDAADKFGRTALMTASIHGRLGCVKALLAENATVDIRDPEGFTALLFSAMYGHADVFRELTKAGADVHVQNYGGKNCPFLAAIYGRVAILPLCLEAKVDLTQEADIVLSLADPISKPVIAKEISRQRQRRLEIQTEYDHKLKLAQLHYDVGLQREEDGDALSASLYFAVASRIMPDNAEFAAAAAEAGENSTNQFMGFVSDLDSAHKVERRAVIALTPTHLEVRSYVLRGFTVKTKETLSVAFAYNDYMSVELLPITYPHDVSGPDSMPSPSSSSIANNRAVFASATTAAAAGSSLYVKAPVYQPVLRIRISYPSPDALLRSPADSVDFSATWDHRRSSAQPPTVITVLLPDRTLSPASPLNPVSLLSRLQKLKEAALVQAEAEVADDLSARDEWRRVRKPVSDSLSALPVAPSFHPPSLGSEGKAAILRL